MNTETIITTVLFAAAFLQVPIRALVSQSLRDIYEATILPPAENSDRIKARRRSIWQLKNRPPPRKALLVEESEPANLPADPDLARLTSNSLYRYSPRLRRSRPQTEPPRP